ncbi:excinuclease [Pseudomonas chlororaphis]|uniref:Excinuclease n=1 Tax=Pseudomonas chlororaphis TaxID=587753 RepID=A0A1Q8EX37_9PSED|nr:excinuclease [Pseudomonas chlororaphis]OLF56356.1 excinuclease [Pseudomonas chlororaphis]
MQVKALIAATLFTLLPSASQATNLLYMPFEKVVSDAIRAGRLDGSVKFYLAGNDPDGKVVQVLLTDVASNRKTNGFNKSDNDACEWVVQSTLIALQDAAKRVGANAVINIVSYYKHHVRKDLNTYECHAGVLMAGVALRGDLVRLQ